MTEVKLDLFAVWPQPDRLVVHPRWEALLRKSMIEKGYIWTDLPILTSVFLPPDTALLWQQGHLAILQFNKLDLSWEPRLSPWTMYLILFLALIILAVLIGT